MIHSLSVLVLTALACSILGVFITLRRLSMLTDAISHTVLLGIVLAFFITEDLKSPWLMVGATLMGIITVILIEALGNSGLVKKDDAIGVVFPILFSIAVLLISKYAKNSHLDTDVVLMGEVIYAGLDTVDIFGFTIARSALIMGIVLILNLSFVLIFYKELKASTFDQEYSKLIGIPVGFIFYALMTLTSLTTVAAFDAVGTILVISFFIAPPATAILVTKDLKETIIRAALIGAFNSIVGHRLAIITNTSMAGMCATINLIVYLLVLVLNKGGVLRQSIKRKRDSKQFYQDLLLVHIGNHSSEELLSEENQEGEIKRHLNWSDRDLSNTINDSLNDGLLYLDNKHYLLTGKGRERYNNIKRQYEI